MAKRVEIVNVTVNDDVYFVKYVTGTIRKFHADNLPKTVQQYLESSVLCSPAEPIVALTVVPAIPNVYHSNQIHSGLIWDITNVMLPIFRIILVAIATALRFSADVLDIIADIIEAIDETCHDIKEDVKPFLNSAKTWWKNAWSFRAEICLENRGTNDEF